MIPGSDDGTSRAVSGAPLDFESFVAAEWEALWRLAYLITGHTADAEDIVQDVLARIWPRWAEISAKGDPGAYLRRCLANARVSAWRKTRHMTPFADLPARLESSADTSERVADAMLLAQALRTLNPRQRAVVALRYLEDRSYSDIADICAITEAAARSLTRHALARMRREMRDA